MSAIGVYAERCEVHMGIVWIKALTLRTGHANVIAPRRPRARDDATRACSTPRPLVSHHMKLDDAARGLRGATTDREALKIVMTP